MMHGKRGCLRSMTILLHFYALPDHPTCFSQRRMSMSTLVQRCTAYAKQSTWLTTAVTPRGLLGIWSNPHPVHFIWHQNPLTDFRKDKVEIVTYSKLCKTNSSSDERIVCQICNLKLKTLRWICTSTSFLNRHVVREKKTRHISKLTRFPNSWRDFQFVGKNFTSHFLIFRICQRKSIFWAFGSCLSAIAWEFPK